jgi:hypothetical protein
MAAALQVTSELCTKGGGRPLEYGKVYSHPSYYTGTTLHYTLYAARIRPLTPPRTTYYTVVTNRGDVGIGGSTHFQRPIVYDGEVQYYSLV